MRTWAWYRLWQKVKPLLNVTRVEDELKALEDKAAAAQANFEKEEKLRKELEANLAKMTAEKNELLNRLQAESGTVAEFHDKQNKLMSQKADLEAQLSVTFMSTSSFLSPSVTPSCPNESMTPSILVVLIVAVLHQLSLSEGQSR